MRVEVLVGSDDPLIYPLKSPKIFIGGSEACDVVLPYDGISKKHLCIVSEDDKYYVIDQGSTNGSFMNEERLVPGRRVEFTSFFPVRLGDNTLISLLSDDESMLERPIKIPVKAPRPITPKTSQATRAISLKDLRKTSTKSLVKEREKRRAAMKQEIAAKPKEKSNSKFLPFLAFGLFGFSVYYNFFVAEPEVVTTMPIEEVGEIPQVVEAPIELKEAPQIERISESDLTPKEIYGNLLNNPKCMTEEEEYLCGIVNGAGEGKYGVVQVGTTYHVLINGTKYLREGALFIAGPAEQSEFSLNEYKKMLLHTTSYIFLLKGFSEDVKTELFGEYKLSFAFYNEKETGPEIEFVLAITPSALKDVKPLLNINHLQSIRHLGPNAFRATEGYYRIY